MKNNMGVIIPQYITDLTFFSSNVPEDEYPEWSATSTYALGDWVQISAEGVHAVYRSVKENNLGNNPGLESTDPDVVPSSWARAGATNRWRMFDAFSQATENANSIDVVIHYAGRINAIALLDVDASTVQVMVLDGDDNVVFDQTSIMIDHSVATSFWGYFFEPRAVKRNLVVRGLPNYANARLRVIIARDGGSVRCNNLVIGSYREVGGSRYGAEIGITDYSVKKRDVFGNLYLKQRGFSKRNALDVWVQSTKVDSTNNFLTEFRAKPLVWVGAPGYESMVIYGIYNKFRILISYPTHSVMSIDLEGFV